MVRAQNAEPRSWTASVIGGEADSEPDSEPRYEEADISLIWRETWAGAIVSNGGWTAYSGMTFSPLGGIQDNGLRLRLAGGYGEHRFPKTRWVGEPILDNIKFNVREMRSFADVLVGWQQGFGPLTIKLFAGGTLDANILTSTDQTFAEQGRNVAAKVVAETWVNLSPRFWLSLDGHWSGGHSALGSESAPETKGVNGRIGYRITPWLSTGVEASWFASYDDSAKLENNSGRAGVLLRAKWYNGEASISGGVTIDKKRDSPDEPQAYGSINWLTRF